MTNSSAILSKLNVERLILARWDSAGDSCVFPKCFQVGIKHRSVCAGSFNFVPVWIVWMVHYSLIPNVKSSRCEPNGSIVQMVLGQFGG